MPVRASDFSMSSMNLKSISSVFESPTGGANDAAERGKRKETNKHRHTSGEVVHQA